MHPKSHRFYTSVIKVLACTAMLALYAGNLGCSESSSALENPSGVAETTAEPVPKATPPTPKPVDHAPAIVESVGEALESALKADVEQRYLAPKLEAKASIKPRRDPLRYRAALGAIYQGENSRLYFLSEGQLNDDGAAILTILKDAYNHGLGQRVFHVPDIEKSLKSMQRMRDEINKDKPLALSTTEQKAVEDAVRKAGLQPDDPELNSKVVALVLAQPSPAPELMQALGRWEKDAEKLFKKEVDVELKIADAVARFGWEMRYQNRAWFDQAQFKKKNKIQRRRIQQGLLAKDLSTQFPKGNTAAFISELVPKHEQYPKLVEALKRYRSIHTAGGWEKVSKSSIRKGSWGKVVLELKKRLVAEGFFPAPPAGTKLSNAYDDDMDKAVRFYQRAHQIKEGKPDWLFWKSLNVPLEDRIEQIKVTLARWRESGNTDPNGYYVTVNIPDFHAEVWNNGVREMRFRVIVGNKKFGCDERDGRWKRINATPVQSKMIKTVIINPFWNIPERIRKEEILPMAKNRPNFFKNSNYECVKWRGDECTRVRQSSGKDNALGRVKFIFPNHHNTYMHDTPKKHFFDFPVRAFSHGCMRVHNPMNFAEHLLKNDEQWDESYFNTRLNQKTEYGFKLNKEVPIHIEYYTTRVDDDGLVHFLSDVYRYDYYRLRGEDISWRRCSESELSYARDPSNDDGTEDDTGTSDVEEDLSANRSKEKERDSGSSSSKKPRDSAGNSGSDVKKDPVNLPSTGGGSWKKITIKPKSDGNSNDGGSKPKFRKINITPN